MGTVRCERCGGHCEAASIEEAVEIMDHAPGLAKGVRCDPARGVLVMDGTTTAPKVQPKVEAKVEKPKATKSSNTEAS